MSAPQPSSTAMARRQEILYAANARGLTVGGTAVTVSGSRNAFATVSLAEGPFKGWSVEYSWQTIEDCTNGSGQLRT